MLIRETIEYWKSYKTHNYTLLVKRNLIKFEASVLQKVRLRNERKRHVLPSNLLKISVINFTPFSFTG